MTWVKLDDALTEHPKIVALSDPAFALWIASLAYCNRNLTDGFVPSAVGIGQLRYCEGNTTPAIRELERAGLWVPTTGGWAVHDYLDYQPSRSDVALQREQTAERVRRHRNAVTNADGNGTGNADVPGTGSTALVVGSKSKVFGDFWTAYPRKVGKRAARTAFDKAVGRALPEVVIAGAERLRDDPNREAEYTPHPSTWLNRDGWEDDPLPARNGHAPYDHAAEILRRAGGGANGSRTIPEPRSLAAGVLPVPQTP